MDYGVMPDGKIDKRTKRFVQVEPAIPCKEILFVVWEPFMLLRWIRWYHHWTRQWFLIY